MEDLEIKNQNKKRNRVWIKIVLGSMSTNLELIDAM